MKTAIIACKTIELELRAAMTAAGCSLDVFWLEQGLHNAPEKLHNRLQEILDSLEGYERVLLVMGFCGNSVLGIRSSAELILPKTDDCIGLVLGSCARKREYPGSLFLTRGWLDGEHSMWWEYRRSLERYGPRRTDRIFDAMLRNYRNVILVDTGCFDPGPARQEVDHIAETFRLEPLTVGGDLGYLNRLLTGPWDPSEFIILPPGRPLSESDLLLQSPSV